MTAALEVSGLRYVLPGRGKGDEGRGGRQLVADVSFTVGPGETLVLLGRSGSGKTTTLKLINRLLEPTGGEVRVAGERAADLAPTRLRRRIGYVIQEVGLFPHFTVERNVGLVPRLEAWPPGRIATRVRELLQQGGGTGAGAARQPAPISPDQLVKLIDHTVLKPEATAEEIEKLCKEAAENKFFSVCVNPTWVPKAKQLLRGTPVKVCAVVGFPLGAQSPEIKTLEARRALREGANEIDMVINIGALKSKDDLLVARDIRGVVEVCDEAHGLSKVIIETSLLSDEEKVRACQLSMKAGADFVKTSTGFSKAGATVEDVRLMAKTVAPRKLGVKASGGVRTYADVVKMVEAGATRIGSSNSVAILQEARQLAGKG